MKKAVIVDHSLIENALNPPLSDISIQGNLPLPRETAIYGPCPEKFGNLTTVTQNLYIL